MSCLLSPHSHHSEPIKARKSRNQNEGDYTLQPKAWEACWGRAWVCRVMYLPFSHWDFASSAQSCPSWGIRTEKGPADLASEPWPGGVGKSFSSVTQSCPTICDSMNYSTPGLPVQHQLPEFTQTRVHWVGDASQPSHPLLSPSPTAFKLSQRQDIFQWVHSSYQVAKILEFQLHHQSFQWIFRVDSL